MGNFGLCWFRGQTEGSAPDEKSFYGGANMRTGCTMVPFLRPKRKFRVIPGQKSCWGKRGPATWRWPSISSSVVSGELRTIGTSAHSRLHVK